MIALVNGTVPRGITGGVRKDGTVAVGDYNISPGDFETLIAHVRQDEKYQSVLSGASAVDVVAVPDPVVTGTTVVQPEPAAKPSRKRKE